MKKLFNWQINLRNFLNLTGVITIIWTLFDASNGHSLLWKTIFLETQNVREDVVLGTPILFTIGVVVWLLLGLSLFFIPASKEETYQMRFKTIKEKFNRLMKK